MVAPRAAAYNALALHSQQAALVHVDLCADVVSLHVALWRYHQSSSLAASCANASTSVSIATCQASGS